MKIVLNCLISLLFITGCSSLEEGGEMVITDSHWTHSNYTSLEITGFPFDFRPEVKCTLSGVRETIHSKESAHSYTMIDSVSDSLQIVFSVSSDILDNATESVPLISMEDISTAGWRNLIIALRDNTVDSFWSTLLSKFDAEYQDSLKSYVKSISEKVYITGIDSVSMEIRDSIGDSIVKLINSIISRNDLLQELSFITSNTNSEGIVDLDAITPWVTRVKEEGLLPDENGNLAISLSEEDMQLVRWFNILLLFYGLNEKNFEPITSQTQYYSICIEQSLFGDSQMISRDTTYHRFALSAEGCMWRESLLPDGSSREYGELASFPFTVIGNNTSIETEMFPIIPLSPALVSHGTVPPILGFSALTYNSNESTYDYCLLNWENRYNYNQSNIDGVIITGDIEENWLVQHLYDGNPLEKINGRMKRLERVHRMYWFDSEGKRNRETQIITLVSEVEL
jgi:hypothetical protein